MGIGNNQRLMECSRCGNVIDLVKEDGFVVENLPACKKCKNKYWKIKQKEAKNNG